MIRPNKIKENLKSNKQSIVLSGYFDFKKNIFLIFLKLILSVSVIYLLGIIFSPIRYFLKVNIASLLAIIDWLLGKKQNTWQVIR